MTAAETLNQNLEAPPVLELGADLSPAVRAIEVAYRAIQRKYPGTPDATIVVKRDEHAWGHTTVAKTWAPSKLDPAGDASHFEIMISGENLRRGPEFVAATLLHESSHAFNLAAGTLDTDTNGRHNKAFKLEAERRGLVVTQVGWHGFTGTELDDEGRALHKALIATIEKGLAKSAAPARANLSHLPRPTAPAVEGGKGAKGTVTVVPVAPPKRGNRNLLLATCGCGLKIRLSRGVLEKARPMCQDCNTEFAA
jgi:hypothetical protein